MNFPLEAMIREKRAAGLVPLNQHVSNLGNHRIRAISVSKCTFVDSCNQIISPKIKIMGFRAGKALKRSTRQQDWEPKRMLTCSS